MRKRLLTMLLALSMVATTAVVPVSEPVSAVAATKKAAKKSTKKTTKKSTKKLTAKQKKAQADQKAADKVAKLIDRIYVQNRTATTDKDCKKAKLEWDKLTSAQKKLVEGENADPDYFGRDTGDASADNPRNWNHIGENEILVVSFGTSFNESRAEDIGGVEDAIADQYERQGWKVRRAFTSQIIINHVQARDGEKIDNVQQALDRAVKNGVKNLVIQPTHLMQGKEYNELKDEVNAYASRFQTVTFSEPLLGEVGKDTTTVNADKETVAKAVTAEAVKDNGDSSLEAAAASGTAFVFMGHGTSHQAAITYDQMQTQMEDLGYKNVFIGTVEGNPEDTACDRVIAKVKAAGYTKVVLRPLMAVAGDHANNDMAGGDSDSWKSQFAKTFGAKNISCQIKGLGRIPEIEQIYINHLARAVAGNKSLTVSAVTGSAIQAVKAPVSAKKKLS
jgi:cobalamin biosynthesis Co2+ chelatase CbiK